jgi:hypothetical protein
VGEVLESLCIRGPLGCMCIGLLHLVWGKGQPLDYIIVILLFESIEQPLFPSIRMYSLRFEILTVG